MIGIGVDYYTSQDRAIDQVSDVEGIGSCLSIIGVITGAIQAVEHIGGHV